MINIQKLRSKIRTMEIKEAEASGALKTIREELKDTFKIESQGEVSQKLGELNGEEQLLRQRISKLERKIEKIGV